jgi:hypothetical protein
MPLTDPRTFQCPTCGNSILAMDWAEIHSMLLTYNQINGYGTATELAAEIGVIDATVSNWIYHQSEPRYNSGRKLALYLKGRFQAMPDEKIDRFLKHHRTALKCKNEPLAL